MGYRLEFLTEKYHFRKDTFELVIPLCIGKSSRMMMMTNTIVLNPDKLSFVHFFDNFSFELKY